MLKMACAHNGTSPHIVSTGPLTSTGPLSLSPVRLLLSPAAIFLWDEYYRCDVQDNESHTRPDFRPSNLLLGPNRGCRLCQAPEKQSNGNKDVLPGLVSGERRWPGLTPGPSVFAWRPDELGPAFWSFHLLPVLITSGARSAERRPFLNNGQI